MNRDKLGQFDSTPRPEMRKRIQLLCPVCSKSFEVKEYRTVKLPKENICCSVSCASKRKGTDHLRGKITEEVKRKISNTLTGKYTGKKASRWNGGRTVHVDGYIYIYSPNHPFRDHHGYVFEHRLIMEKQLGRYLQPEEHIHHLDGDKANNRIENLKIFSNSEHLKYEWENGVNIKNASKTWFPKGNIPWNKKI